LRIGQIENKEVLGKYMYKHGLLDKKEFLSKGDIVVPKELSRN